MTVIPCPLLLNSPGLTIQTFLSGFFLDFSFAIFLYYLTNC